MSRFDWFAISCGLCDWLSGCTGFGFMTLKTENCSIDKLREQVTYVRVVTKLITNKINHVFCYKKTVVAVLDRLVNPHWPYLPEKTKELGENSDRIERAWSSVPDDPMNYDFFYHVLDADDQGREPKIDEKTLNELFNPKSMSCLRCIAESDDKVTLI